MKVTLCIRIVTEMTCPVAGGDLEIVWASRFHRCTIPAIVWTFLGLVAATIKFTMSIS